MRRRDAVRIAAVAVPDTENMAAIAFAAICAIIAASMRFADAAIVAEISFMRQKGGYAAFLLYYKVKMLFEYLPFFKKYCTISKRADVAKLADAPDLESGGQPCRFKSCRPHQKNVS